MKIAVCLSGHLRTFASTFNMLDWSLSGHEVHYFVHTWDYFGNSASWCYPIDEVQKVPDNFLEKIVVPKKHVIQKKEDVDLSYQGPLRYRPWPAHDQVVTERVFGLIYKMWACDVLRQEYEKETSCMYDAVIRTRPDFRVGSCEIDQLKLDNDTLFVSSFDESADTVPPSYDMMGQNMMPDKICVASPEAMTKFTSAWIHLKEYIEEGAFFHTEGLLQYHATKMNLRVERNSGIQGSILRNL